MRIALSVSLLLVITCVAHGKTAPPLASVYMDIPLGTVAHYLVKGKNKRVEIISRISESTHTKIGRTVTVVQNVVNPKATIVQRYYLTRNQVIQVLVDGATEKNRRVIIQGPIVKGTQWSKVTGDFFIKYGIEDTNATVKTPVGTFKNVLVVRQLINMGGPDKWPKVVSYFAPGVGLVAQKTTGMAALALTLEKLTRPKGRK